VLAEDLASCFGDDLFLSHSGLRDRSLVMVERVRHYMAHLLHLLDLLRIVMFEALFTYDVRIKCIIEQLGLVERLLVVMHLLPEGDSIVQVLKVFQVTCRAEIQVKRLGLLITEYHALLS